MSKGEKTIASVPNADGIQEVVLKRDTMEAYVVERLAQTPGGLSRKDLAAMSLPFYVFRLKAKGIPILKEWGRHIAASGRRGKHARYYLRPDVRVRVE
jgi:hypothetical protein